jgi:lysophospholipase L1-like esterase
MLQKVLYLCTGALLTSLSAPAQLVDEFNPPRANCCLMNTARSLADQLHDWNQLGRYHGANEELKRKPAEPNRVIFMGDSITDFWKLDESFPGKPFVNRGISCQTTAQMLVRMYPDVIDLKPSAMVVLAGINDVSHNTGPATAEMVEQNIMAMTELAQHHGIKVILCSVTPVSDYPFLKQQTESGAPPGPGRGPRFRMTEGHPPSDILKLNAWLKACAAQVNAIYADYFTVLLDEKGSLKDGLSNDGLHPNEEGYKVMVPIAASAIQKALR